MSPIELTALADCLENICVTNLWKDNSVLRQVDAQMANHFMPLSEGAWLAFDHPFCNDYGDQLAPDYTTSLDAIINLIPDHATWLRDVNHEGKLTMRVSWGEVSGEGSGVTPAMGLCVAFLRACVETYA